jgi:SPIRAL1-like protein
MNIIRAKKLFRSSFFTQTNRETSEEQGNTNMTNFRSRYENPRPGRATGAPAGGASQILFGDYGLVPSDEATLSANLFANGRDQNCGNVLTDRPTSRVVAPPGGASSIWFSEHGIVAKESTDGSSDTSRTLSNVSDVLSDSPATREVSIMPQDDSREATISASKLRICQRIAEEKVNNVASIETGGHGSAASGLFTEGSISANKFANGDCQNVGNFMTGKPTTRVHAPPGGVSQIVFG